jgi:hypothetical protein
MYGVEGQEEGGAEEEDGFDGVEDTGRDGVRVAHLLGGLNTGWRYEFQSITEVLLRERPAGDHAVQTGVRHDRLMLFFPLNPV